MYIRSDTANKIWTQGKEGKEERLRYILPNFCNIYLYYQNELLHKNGISMTSRCHSIIIKLFCNKEDIYCPNIIGFHSVDTPIHLSDWPVPKVSLELPTAFAGRWAAQHQDCIVHQISA